MEKDGASAAAEAPSFCILSGAGPMEGESGEPGIDERFFKLQGESAENAGRRTKGEKSDVRESKNFEKNAKKVEKRC